MHPSFTTWQFIREHLEADHPVALLYVLESRGSSPGRQGFLMGVAANGALAGSIGGGIMEHKLVELAREILSGGDHTAGIRRQVHDKKAPRHQSGMICSGEQTVWIFPLSKNELPALTAISTTLQQNKKGVLSLSPGEIHFTPSVETTPVIFNYTNDDQWSYQGNIGYQHELTIIGGGHCSLALSKLMAGMDFYIRVYDDRPGVSTLEQNKAAHEKIVIENYSALTALVKPGLHHYVVIMTMGYRSDDEALRALQHQPYAYLGMLGSSNKIKRMRQQYAAENILFDQSQQVHAPVGLPIKSQSPEEIAVSIAAEIISIKNSRL